MSEIKENQLDKNSAQLEIAMMEQEISVMGGYDSESDIIKDIKEQLEDGKIEPAEAVEMVRKIKESKQDYH